MKIIETKYSTPSRDADTVGTTHSSSEETRAEPSTVPMTEHQAGLVYEERLDEREKMSMEEVVCKENMLVAYHRVVSNQGSSGVDGMSVKELAPYIRKEWDSLCESLLEDRYQPSPALKVEIPKPGGKGMRMLGIPTVVDRMIQQALMQVMQPYFEGTFSESSYGFRPGRSAHQAVTQARDHVRSGYRWVVDMDLEKFFDRVNHDILMSRLSRHIEDKRILHLIRRYLQSGMMEAGLVSARTQGVPQGGPLSPLLSNIMLDEMDKELERRGHRFVRYADDCNVYIKSKAAGERVLASLDKFLSKRLRLKLNLSKSAVGRPWQRKFLGYSMTAHKQAKLKVSPESLKRMREKLKDNFRKGRGRSVSRTIEHLNRQLRGWMSYYRLSEVKSPIIEMDQWIRGKLRCVMWRQWKRPSTRRKQLMRYGIEAERAASSASNGRGPWWNAGSSHMNQALPMDFFNKLGLISLRNEQLRWSKSS